MAHRRSTARVLTTIGAAVAILATAGGVTASAQTLTVVAPAAPGGGWDQTARAMQRALRAMEPDAAVQVENVPGAAGTIGLARFVTGERGRPDALLVTGLVMVCAIATNGSAVSLADVTPIARLTGEHEVIVVPADSPFRTLQDLVAALKRAPQSVSWGGGSAGGTDDLLARLLAEAVGVSPAAVNYVAFSGGGEALAALLGGQVTAGVSGFGEFSQALAAGQLRGLATSAPVREPEIDLPTLRELGVPLDLANWRAVVAPPGISAAQQAALTERVRTMVGSAAWRETLQRTGWTDQYLDGPAFRQFLLAEQSRVVGVLARLQTRGDKTPTGWTPTPRTAPAVALALVAGLALLLAWQRRTGVVSASPAAAPAPAPEAAAASHGAPLAGARRSVPGVSDAHLRVAAIAGACIAHALLMSRVGFVPTATLLFVTGAYALGSARMRRNIGIGVALAAALATIFGAGLDVPLPMGSWTR